MIITIFDFLFETTTFDIRKIDFNGIAHIFNFLIGRSSNHIHDLQKLVFGIFTLKQRHSHVHFCNDASYRPDVDFTAIFLLSQNQLWSSVVSRANVGHWNFSFFQNFGTSKITHDQLVIFDINQNILGLDVSVTYSFVVHVCQSSQHLVAIYFSQSIWKIIIFFIVKSQNFVECVGHVVHDQIKKHITAVFFLGKKIIMNFDTVGMVEHFDYLKFSVGILGILKDFFNRNFFFSAFFLSLVNNSESSLANYLDPFVVRTFVFDLWFFSLLFIFLFGADHCGKLGLGFVEDVWIYLRFFVMNLIRIYIILSVHYCFVL